MLILTSIWSFEGFNERKLPARKDFYSSTKDGKIGDDGKILDSHISVKDYLTCEKTWDQSEMKNMSDYHDHYLKKDVLLLVGVYEMFINTCLKYYGLDPCHYFSSPGLRWDPMLKITDIQLGKISDINKYLFIEKGLRERISYIAKRYAKANNKYINDYGPKKSSTFISYLDMNHLYGSTMSEYLPWGRFKWLKNVDKFDVMSINKKGPIGYFLEVDLEYPDELHKLQID